LLHLPLMAEVNRVFLVKFNQQSVLVEYLLPETNRILLVINDLPPLNGTTSRERI
jgi:hypothetical protein